jgi:hypothetical protein
VTLGNSKMAAEAARFSVLWEDQASQDKRAMHMTGFDDEQATRRFALDQREEGARIVAVFTIEGMFRKNRLEKWLEGSV